MTELHKTVLITGASRGIGRAIALLFAEHGAHVLLTARTSQELQKLKEEIEKKKGKASFLVLDLLKDEDIHSLAKWAVDKDIDILINNAGCGFKGAFHKISTKDMDRVLHINQRAPMLLTKLLLPHFFKKQSGTIINIASIAGKIGIAHSVSYCASKHAVVGFTHALFEEVREKNIKVATICPGYVDTELIPETKKINREKMIRPEDVAKACLFIATSSKESCPIEMIIRPQVNPRN
ncbi:MAG: SDR family oxidoreductase [Deltaproteobacteria bacterium]|nr:SDR family oxidoreductase [Deltaproteobacteria bacterium]